MLYFLLQSVKSKGRVIGGKADYKLKTKYRIMKNHYSTLIKSAIESEYDMKKKRKKRVIFLWFCNNKIRAVFRFLIFEVGKINTKFNRFLFKKQNLSKIFAKSIFWGICLKLKK